MFNPPYQGQGLSLPAETGVDGEWVIEGLIFLFRTNPPRAAGEFFGLTNSDGREAAGFDADALAELLAIDVPSLLLLNQRRLLRVGVEQIATAPGADQTFRAQFQTPFSGISIGFSRATIRGRA